MGVGGAYSTASLENLPNTYCKKSAKHWRLCGQFLMCFPATEGYRVNTCEIFKMINTIAGEHIPGSIKLNNVYARYRLNSGQTSPAIFIPLKSKIEAEHLPLSSRLRKNTLRYWWYWIFETGGHMIQSEHIKSCLNAQKRFLLFKEPGFLKKNLIVRNVDELKAYRLIPLTPHPPFSFYTTFYGMGSSPIITFKKRKLQIPLFNHCPYRIIMIHRKSIVFLF